MKTLNKASLSVAIVGLGLMLIGSLLFQEDSAIVTGGILFVAAVGIKALISL